MNDFQILQKAFHDCKFRLQKEEEQNRKIEEWYETIKEGFNTIIELYEKDNSSSIETLNKTWRFTAPLYFNRQKLRVFLNGKGFPDENLGIYSDDICIDVCIILS
jgi:hypothetical protein